MPSCLQFFDGKELKNRSGAAMGTTEDAARMRVNRGLKNLREFFTREGCNPFSNGHCRSRCLAILSKRLLGQDSPPVLPLPHFPEPLSPPRQSLLPRKPLP